MASLPWVEKHRPKDLNEVVGNVAAVERLRIIAQHGNLPNLILTGPPGIGKTSSLLCLCRQLLGPNLKNAFLELNASDERGIEVVRQDIKAFAKRHVLLPEGRHKVILLDESDSMTEAAQQAMRRIMEKYSRTTRFVFACNQSDKVIEAIQSRCAIIRFTRIQEGEIATRLVKICKAENVEFTKDGIDALATLSDGDLRTAVNNLQVTAIRFNFINQANVESAIDVPDPTAIQGIFSALSQDAFRAALTNMHGLIERGHSASDIISSLLRYVRKTDTMGDKMKLYVMKEIGFAQLRLSQGDSSPLQLDGLVSQIYIAMNEHKQG